MKNARNLIIAFLLIAALSFGQATMSSTTLGAALSNSATTVTLASTSTMLSRGQVNQVDTVLYVDKEYMWVNTVVDSTHVTVQRGKGIGASQRPVAHANGAKVYFAITTTSGVANSYFRNEQPTAEASAACTANTIFVLPIIYLFSGDILDCKRTGAAGTSGQFILVGNGTMAGAGKTISNFCTGTVGSAESDFLNGAACSSATTATARQIINSPGTLANFYVFSSAAFLGTGGTATTVYKNGVATAITCSAIATAVGCSDLIHQVSVVPGDAITFLNVSATSDTAANISAAVGLY